MPQLTLDDSRGCFRDEGATELVVGHMARCSRVGGTGAVSLVQAVSGDDVIRARALAAATSQGGVAEWDGRSTSKHPQNDRVATANIITHPVTTSNPHAHTGIRACQLIRSYDDRPVVVVNFIVCSFCLAAALRALCSLTGIRGGLFCQLARSISTIPLLAPASPPSTLLAVQTPPCASFPCTASLNWQPWPCLWTSATRRTTRSPTASSRGTAAPPTLSSPSPSW